MRLTAILVFIAGISPVAAQMWVSPTPLPRPRPEATETTPAPPVPEVQQDAPVAAPAEEPVFPMPRRRPVPETPAEEPAPDQPAVADQPEVAEPPAEPKPPRIYQTACPAVLAGQAEATIQPPIAEGQCVVQSPLALSAVIVNGRSVEVSGGVVTGCGIATVLPQWASAIDGYLFSRMDTRLSEIIVGTSFMCRPRNNVAGADISEHGFGEALDIVGFRLEDGRTVTVEGGWSDALSEEGRLLRFAHDSACSLFTTTLGPEANALHSDHFHVDLGCHGGRCTAQMCE
jgi:hypothetical protein